MDKEWSDHAPLKLVLNSREVRPRNPGKIFRFEHMWTEHEECEMVIKEAWGSGETRVSRAIQQCALDLNKWSENSLGWVMKEIGKKWRKLKRLNEGNKTEARVRERKKVIAEIANFLRHEEKYWRQRSRILWLTNGDKNTTLFHRRASQRKKNNSITMLRDEDVTERWGDYGVGEIAYNYFVSLFEMSYPVGIQEALQGVERRVSDDMNDRLRAEYTGKEVMLALEQMHPLKAHGPDGMNALFYQAYWHIVGQDVVAAVLAILRGRGYAYGD